MAKKKLSAMQAKFVQEYLLCLNSHEAARRAGYKAGKDQAGQLMKHPDVKSAIEEGMKRREKKFEITEEKILTELAKVAFGNLLDIVDDDGLIPDSAESGAYIAGFSSSESSGSEGNSKSFSVSAHNKVKALELLGKHVGLWKVKDAGQTDDSGHREAVLSRVSDALRKSRNRRGKAGGDEA